MEDEVKTFLERMNLPQATEFLLDEEPPEEVDPDRLRAFHRGTLSVREEQEVAFLVTHYRRWYEADRRLVLGDEIIAKAAENGISREDEPEDESESGRPTASVSRRNRSRRNRIQVLALAASVLVAVFGLSWAIWAHLQVQRANQEIATLRDELAPAWMEIAVARKQRMLREVPSATSEMWGGDVSGEVLQIEVPNERIICKTADVSDEAIEKAEAAREPLQKLIDAGDAPGEAYLELAAVDIAVRRLEEAATQLKKAREILGDDPAVDNVEAMLLTAKADMGDSESENEAKRLLKASVAKHPDFLPGLYNWALFLQRTKRYQESEAAWQEYLKREDRPAYRSAAENRLDELRASSGDN